MKTTIKSNQVQGGADRPREVTGRMAFICLVAFFGVVAGVNAIMVHAAVSTFGGVETESSYQTGRVFAREASAAHEQDALHWQVAATIAPADNATARVEVVALDATGARIRNLTAHATFSHPTDRRFDQVLTLTELAPGRFAGSSTRAAGQWDLVIELDRDGTRMFRSKNRITVC
jgi:nitrogen fixation protein FixH